MPIVKYGIDISKWQGDFDLSKHKDKFIIIRASFGCETDAWAKKNMDKCEALGIPYGVYCYSYATTVARAKEEAHYLLSIIKGRRLEYPVYFDMEDADNYKAKRNAIEAGLLTDMTNAFCEVIERAGYFVGVYASESWFNTYLKGVTKYDKWVASWGANDGNVNRNFEGRAGMLQFTSKYLGNLDGNVAYKDYPKIIRNLGLNGFSKEEQAPRPTPPVSGRKYKIGDDVKFTTCYLTSTDPNEKAIPVERMLVKHGKITAIVNAKNPYLLNDGLCWVNDGDISGFYNGVNPPNANCETVKLKYAPLYVSSTSNAMSNRVSGTYYKWSNEVVNGRIRITTSKSRIGIVGQITGWVEFRG